MIYPDDDRDPIDLLPPHLKGKEWANRSLLCVLCGQDKLNACQCEAPEFVEIPRGEPKRPGTYYVVRSPHGAQMFGRLAHDCGCTEPVAGNGGLEVLRGNALAELRRGCRQCRAARCEPERMAA